MSFVRVSVPRNKPPRQTPLPYAAPLPPFSHQAIATAPSYGPGAGAVSPAGGYFTSPGGYYAGPAGGDPGAFLAMDAHTYHPHPHPPPAYFGLPGLFGPPPPVPPYYGSHLRADYVPAPSRSNKRKRDPEEDEEGGGLFPGEDATLLYRKDIAGLSKSVNELQHTLQALRRETLSYGHTGVGYCPQQGPCYTHSGPYGFQPHQSYEVPRYVPHPPPPPTSHQAAQAQPPPPALLHVQCDTEKLQCGLRGPLQLLCRGRRRPIPCQPDAHSAYASYCYPSHYHSPHHISLPHHKHQSQAP